MTQPRDEGSQPGDAVYAHMSDDSIQRRWKDMLAAVAWVCCLIFLGVFSGAILIRDLGPSENVDGTIESARTIERRRSSTHEVTGTAQDNKTFSFDSRELIESFRAVPQNVTIERSSITGATRSITYDGRTYERRGRFTVFAGISLAVTSLLAVASLLRILRASYRYWAAAALLILNPVCSWLGWQLAAS